MPIAAILVYQPDGTVLDYPLTSERIVIGRAEDCGIVVEGKLISRRHACIFREGQTYFLEDLGSQNGTTLNGEVLTEATPLHDQDNIALGKMGKLVFSDSDSTSSLVQPSIVGVWLDVERQDIWIDGKCLNPKLSPAQFKLMEVLSSKKDRICNRSEIISAVWPDITEGVSDEAVDALIKRVRARLGEIKNGDQYLITFRSRGLMLRSP